MSGKQAVVEPRYDSNNRRLCSATSKRTQLPCRGPAVKESNVCRVHGWDKGRSKTTHGLDSTRLTKTYAERRRNLIATKTAAELTDGLPDIATLELMLDDVLERIDGGADVDMAVMREAMIRLTTELSKTRQRTVDTAARRAEMVEASIVAAIVKQVTEIGRRALELFRQDIGALAPELSKQTDEAYERACNSYYRLLKQQRKQAGLELEPEDAVVEAAIT